MTVGWSSSLLFLSSFLVTFLIFSTGICEVHGKSLHKSEREKPLDFTEAHHDDWVVLESPTADANENNSAATQIRHNLRNIGTSDKTSPRNATNSATTLKLLHPDFCRDLSEEECVALDQQMLEGTRQLVTTTQGTGFLRFLVLPMRFTDHIDRSLPSTDEIRDLFERDEGVLDYLRAVAGPGDDNIDFDVGVMPWLDTDNTEEFYSYGVGGRTTQFVNALDPILSRLAQETDVDFADFDQNGDNIIDAIIVLHSSYPGHISTLDCEGRPRNLRISGFAMNYNRVLWSKPSITPYSAANIAVASALHLPDPDLCHDELATISIITHEALHLFGLPDLADQSWYGAGIGNFGVMGYPYGIGDRNKPGYVTAWSKKQAGWHKPVPITKSGTYTIESSIRTNQAYAIYRGFPEGEYLVIENRRKERWDANLYTEGILIFHIDEAKANNRESGYPGQEFVQPELGKFPENGRHYKVAVVQADGNFDLERNGGGRGDAGDFWKLPTQALGPGPLIQPNTDSYQGGVIRRTNITIFNFQVLKAATGQMSFDVSFGDETSAPTQAPTPAPTPPTLQPTPTGPNAPSTDDPITLDTSSPTRGVLVSPFWGSPGGQTTVIPPPEPTSSALSSSLSMVLPILLPIQAAIISCRIS